MSDSGAEQGLPPDYPARVRSLRERLGLSQRRLAALLDVSYATVGHWERGHSHPSPLAWQRLLQMDADGSARILPSSSLLVRRPAARPRTNLPAPLTSFVGRERELAEVRRLLATARLLTLTGTGGCGKTRLALEAAAPAADRTPSPDSSIGSLEGDGMRPNLTESSAVCPSLFPDGVWLVELGALTNPVLVPQALATSLGMREQPGRELAEMLVEFLRPQRLLLMLDNCEHLVETCAALAERLLQRCPLLSILATSRESLGIAGEQVWRVPSLSLPPVEEMAFTHPSPIPLGERIGLLSSLGAGTPSYPAPASEAVQLFVDRARLQQPEFEADAATTLAVARVCLRLDGLPLAIELAAGWVSTLPVEQIADRLDGRFQLLVGGRTSLSRHQTLRAAIDWSYDLLSEAEQGLFNRLSIFAGSFSLEAAEAVSDLSPAPLAADGPVPEREGDPMRAGETTRGEEQNPPPSPDSLLGSLEGEGLGLTRARPSVLALLRALVGKSLVVAETAGSEVRYRLLETLREYGRDRLRECGDLDATRRRHAEFYLAQAQAAASTLFGREQARWLERLERDHENLRAAQRWFANQGDAERELRLTSALWRFWYLRGHLREGRSSLEGALRRRGAASIAAQAKALNGAGILSWFLGDIERAAALHDAALRLSRRGEDRRELAMSLNMLGLVARTRGELARATALCTEAHDLSRQLGDDWGVAFSLYLQGEIVYFQGDQRQAEQLWRRALTIFRDCGDLWGIGYTLINLGNASHFFDDLDEALLRFGEGIEICRSMGDPWGTAYSLAGLGEVMRDRGEYVHAAALTDESLVLRRRLGDRIGVARSLNTLAHLALSRGNLEDAALLLRESLTVYHEVQYARGIARCLAVLAEIAASWGTQERAARLEAAAAGLRSAISASLSAREQAAYEQRLGVLRSALGGPAFDAASERGYVMGVEEAVAYALTTIEQGIALGAQAEQRTETRGSGSPRSAARDPNLGPLLGLSRGGLTTREAEVLRLIGTGFSNKEIAGRLFLSLRTVERHITSIYAKIGARGKADAIAYAFQHGLTPSAHAHQ